MKKPLILAAAAFAVLLAAPASAQMAERQARPVTTASVAALSGMKFSEPASQLPIDTRFSQSIQTVALDLGLTCGQIEAYGWSMKSTEQNRVDALFTNSAVELNRLNYRVTPQNPSAAGEDITVYTATRADDARRHLLHVWSAGDAGLLLLVCDAKGDLGNTAPASMGTLGAASDNSPSFVEPQPADIDPQQLVGVWEGTYNCRGQGKTGGKLTFSKVKSGAEANEHAVEGLVDFFPVAGNSTVERGSYKISGTFNSVTQQAYFEPGKWLKQPKGYIAKPLIAYFDVARGDVSAIFQDTVGCTSFEAHLKPGSADEAKRQALPPKKKVVKKKPKPKPAPVPEPSADEILPQEPISTRIVPETTGDSPVDAPAAPAEPVTVPDLAPTTPSDAVPTPTPVVPAPAAPVVETPAAAPTAAPASPSTTEPTPAPTAAPEAAKPAPTAPAAAAPTAPSAASLTTGKPVIEVDPTAPAAAPAEPVPTGPIVVPNKATTGESAADALARAKIELEAAELARKKAVDQLAVPAAPTPQAETPAQ